jgi:hypothetical protein
LMFVGVSRRRFQERRQLAGWMRERKPRRGRRRDEASFVSLGLGGRDGGATIVVTVHGREDVEAGGARNLFWSLAKWWPCFPSTRRMEQIHYHAFVLDQTRATDGGGGGGGRGRPGLSDRSFPEEADAPLAAAVVNVVSGVDAASDYDIRSSCSSLSLWLPPSWPASASAVTVTVIRIALELADDDSAVVVAATVLAMLADPPHAPPWPL